MLRSPLVVVGDIAMVALIIWLVLHLLGVL